MTSDGMTAGVSTVSRWEYDSAWPTGWAKTMGRPKAQFYLSRNVDEYCTNEQTRRTNAFHHRVVLGWLKWEMWSIIEPKRWRGSLNATGSIGPHSISIGWPRPSCKISLCEWLFWVECGWAWIPWAYKSLKEMDPNETVRIVLRGPKPMPYEFGIKYLEGLAYCAGAHVEWGLIGPKQETPD